MFRLAMEAGIAERSTAMTDATQNPNPNGSEAANDSSGADGARSGSGAVAGGPTAPGSATPESAAPGSSVPASAAPASAAPGSSAPGPSAPERGATAYPGETGATPGDSTAKEAPQRSRA